MMYRIVPKMVKLYYFGASAMGLLTVDASVSSSNIWIPAALAIGSIVLFMYAKQADCRPLVVTNEGNIIVRVPLAPLRQYRESMGYSIRESITHVEIVKMDKVVFSYKLSSLTKG